MRLFLKRDDLIHPELPGNKWRKLKYNLDVARGHDTLLTFGGAYSNHLRAVAAAGRIFGLATVGVVRGEPVSNPVLDFAVSRGMRLSFVDRAAYRNKDALLPGLRAEFGDFYLLPEGGSNEHAVRGCAELVPEIEVPFDLICVPCGTGGTLAGVASGLHAGHALGFAVLKGGGFLREVVAGLTSSQRWSLDTDFHHGGYARRTPELDAFIADFQARHGLLLDWVYVAKMLHGIYRRAGEWQGRTVIAVVTG
ncbi:pyridoxal-phosphate dependent enzyme [Pseudonocardiaceae bacterium YIM PH 21723]|nr:pyridoxal-phosphate dependent enzyme [Pseudonocardiaceae bacterium YIM PH 21723]